jgi:uncharacterized protein
MPVILIDTGPLTALLNPNDEYHCWARDTTRRLRLPLITSEPVLAEVFHLLRRDGCDGDEVFALADSGVLTIGIRFEDERKSFRQLMERYRDVPMSLADAALVRLSELHPDCRVFTLDADFRIYRRQRNKPIPLLMPES